MKLNAIENEIVAVEIDTRTEESEPQLSLKKALIKLLTDPEIRAHLYEAIKTEDALRESMVKIYR